MRSGPIYELSILSPETGHEAFARALDAIVGDMRSDAGISDIRLFDTRIDEQHGFSLQLNFDDNEACDEFLSGRAGALERDIAEAGGRQFSARVLREDDSQNLPGDALCLNCQTPLRGQYCGRCGQRAQSRLISLWELVRDAVGDMFELDSKLWKTLIPLLFRPGRLTADYLKGRRARFMPPFRMYLVLSLTFFIIAFFNPREDLAILFGDEPVAAGDQTGDSGDEEDDWQININGDDPDAVDCEYDESDMEDVPAWLRPRLTPQRLTHLCEKFRGSDGQKAFLEAFLDNIPAALIVLLPLMAFALQLLYPLSRRYYVEHLLFFVHFHAFFFLVLTLQILWVRLIALFGLPDAVGVLPVIGLSLYIPVYLFRGMRRVYGQGFFLTLFKYLILLVVYTLGFALTMSAALAIAAFSI